METGTIVIIVIAVVAVIAGLAVAARWVFLPGMRSKQLRSHFGPEYDRAVEEHGSRAAAERDLRARRSERAAAKLRDLTPEERENHTNSWTAVQREFVDDPLGSVRSARSLTDKIMRDLGYPDSGQPENGDFDDASFEKRAKALSVDHPEAVAHYRRTWAAGHLAEVDSSATENLREALLAYRGIVSALIGGLPQEPKENQEKQAPGAQAGPEDGPARAITSE